MNKKTQTYLDKCQGRTAAIDSWHIVIAEDDREMRALLALSLRKAGYRVTECCDGVGLLTCMEPYLFPNVIGDRDVSLIITDIRMPGLTGMEVLEGAPENEGFPPIILITAFGDEETHTRARDLGAASIFDKPFDIDDLLAEVHALLSPKEERIGQLKAEEDYDPGEADNEKTS